MIITEFIRNLPCYGVYRYWRAFNYAAISRAWQRTVEKRTFRSLRLRQDDLQIFEYMVSNPRRRGCVKVITYSGTKSKLRNDFWALAAGQERVMFSERLNFYYGVKLLMEIIAKYWVTSSIP